MAFAETFKALSDPVRREILQLLKNGKMSAGEIGGHFDMTGATISYHLKILKKADLVWETKVRLVHGTADCYIRHAPARPFQHRSGRHRLRLDSRQP